jgi:predicted Zn finger-like uncharacterized protein
MFKVVQDQLRISEGWVRCGHCDGVFDANAHLQSVGLRVDSEAQTVELTSVSPPENIEDPVEAQAEQHSPAYLAPSQEQAIEDVQARYPDAKDKHSFMRRPRRRSRRYKKSVRVALGLACFVLSALLLLQMVVHERDWLAAVDADIKPVLHALCEVLDCTIQPLRHIEAVVIESSAFTNVQADVYRLSFALKNTAATEMALPAVELTLTDLQDQAVIRRVLLPGDFSLPPVMAAGAEVNANVPLSVKLSEKFSGYRLMIFYP